jgi:hypothetical protein
MRYQGCTGSSRWVNARGKLPKLACRPSEGFNSKEKDVPVGV